MIADRWVDKSNSGIYLISVRVCGQKLKIHLAKSLRSDEEIDYTRSKAYVCLTLKVYVSCLTMKLPIRKEVNVTN